MKWTRLPLAILGGGYLALVFLGSLFTARRAGPRHLPLLPLIYLIIHLAWGIGFWREFRPGDVVNYLRKR